MIADPYGGNPASSGMLMHLIDQVVHLGPQALEQALATYPAILSHHNYLQSVVERKQSPLERAQLRQAIIASLVSIQAGQVSRPRPTNSLSAVPSDAAIAGSSATGSNSQAGPRISASESPGHTADAGPSVGPAAAGTFNMTMTNAPTPVPAPLPTPAPASAQPAQITSAHTASPPTHHHPHIAAAENAPARVFKLQFDARKIVCCSQAPVIVGWDFCNGDAELEETARFFATVD